MTGLSPERKTLPLGRTVITRSALHTLNQEDVATCLKRHQNCDWGECSGEDARENDLSLKEGFRILSVYLDRHDTKFWIITEADRSITTVLLPSEY